MAFLEQLLRAQYSRVPGALNLKIANLVGPVAEPVTVDQVKTFIKAVDDEDDTNIALFISATRANIEKVIQQTIFTQTWLQVQDLPSRRVATRLYKRPVLRVNSASYIQNWNNPSPTVIDPAQYIRSFDEVVPVNFWPTMRGYQSFLLNFDSGIVDISATTLEGLNDADIATAIAVAQAAVPPELQLAICMYCGHFFENREGQGTTTRYERTMALNLPIGDLPKDVRTCILDYLDWRP